MKVKIKKEYINTEILARSDFDVFEKRYLESYEYIVLGILYTLKEDSYHIAYAFSLKYTSILYIDAKYFDITEPSIPNEWIINQYDKRTIISYKEIDDNFALDLVHYGTERSYFLLNKYQKEEELRYYNLDIDNFFSQENLNLTKEEKDTMTEYYKSQPNSAQWEKDKEFLSNYVI